MAIIWRLYGDYIISLISIVWRLFGDYIISLISIHWRLYGDCMAITPIFFLGLELVCGQPPMHHTIAGVSLCAAPMDGTESIINGGKTGNIKVGDSFTINCAIGRKK